MAQNRANYSIPLDGKLDRNRKKYCIGRANNPAKISFKKGMAVFVFLAEDGTEELQFGMPKKNSSFSPVKKKLGEAPGDPPQYIIQLEAKEDRYGAKYFFALVQDDTLEFDLSEDDGYVFFVFASEPGSETLQCSKNRPAYQEKVREYEAQKQNNVEVVSLRGHRTSESGDYEAIPPEAPRFRYG